MIANSGEPTRLFTGIENRREEQVARFEDAWFAGERPAIEDYLPTDDDALRIQVLMELALIDLECRLKAGEAARADTYLDKYPALAQQSSGVVELVWHEFQIRRQQGAVSLDEFGDRFPGHIDALRAKLSSEESSRQPAADPDTGPQRVGRFELVEIAGRGAFGTVWRARDSELDRFVAVKIPSSGRLISFDEEDRFLREARSMAQLRHPGVVAVYEAGRSDGVPYIVAEFIEGLTLSQSLAEKRVSAREAAELLRRVARALDYAHQHGVVHRDLKPSNIMLDRQAAQGSSTQFSYFAAPVELEYEPRVMDFGLALRDHGEATMTIDGQIVGTAAYMSPEQARGESHHVDRRGDVYSAGVILYELLAGETPFRGNFRMVLHQVLHDEPRPVRRFNDQVPRDLETICLKCLEKDPRGRYQSAGELADELGRFLTGQPILARPVGQAERAWRWCRRHPAVSSLTGAIIAVMALGFAGVTWQWLATKRAEQSRTLAQVDVLLRATPDAVPALLGGLEPYRAQVTPVLERILSDPTVDASEQLRARLGLLADDESQAESLFPALFDVDMKTFVILRQQLLSCSVRFEDRLRQILGDDEQIADRRFRAACYLVASPHASQSTWAEHTDFIVEHWIGSTLANPRDYPVFLEVFRPVAGDFVGALAKVYRDSSKTESARHVASNLLIEYLRSDPGALVDLVLDAEPWQLAMVVAAIRGPSRDEAIGLFHEYLGRSVAPGASQETLDKLARQRANAAIAMIELGDSESAWPLLGESNDMSARSYFIDHFPRSGTNLSAITARLVSPDNVAEKRALVLTLGGFPIERIEPDQLAGLKQSLLTLFVSSPDPGVHAAARWSLHQWGFSTAVGAAENKLTRHAGNPVSELMWYIDSLGQTMVVLGPAMFRMGSPPDEPGRYPEEQQRDCSIDRKFAIAATETTIAQFRRFEPDWQPIGRDRDEHHECPICFVSWSQAADYCNWLSELEGIPRDQWCYVPDAEHQGAMREVDGSLARVGYRLPTEAEWEYACRAGTTTARFFGHSSELLPEYAWCPENSPQGNKQPVGLKKPNDLGLYDVYGNADEICHDRLRDPSKDAIANFMVTRGGAAGDLEPPRSALRNLAFCDPDNPKQGGLAMGFRVARTIATSSDAPSDQSRSISVD